MIRKISCFANVLLLVFVGGVQVQAQRSPKVERLEDYGVKVDIGECRSVMRGSRASVKWLARLARTYPKLSFYKVIWAVRFPKETVHFESTYDKSHRSIARQVYADNNALADRFQYGLDEVTDRDLQVVARRGGSFFNFEERIMNRKNLRR